MSAPALPPAEDPTTPPPMTTPPRKASVRLQERRGSNLSLLLDVGTLGVESVCSVSTPKEVWLQLLHTSSRPLTHTALQQAAMDTDTLNSEYQKIPPNFVNAADLDVPGHTIKDRYKTILPNPESRVVLKSPEEEAGPDRYINANYIRGYQGAPRAFIATQGPMLHTVGDFWDMVWQEKSSIIVMVTKLKENHEKCELYWPQTVKEQDDRETGQFGRFILQVKDRRQKDGFTMTDLDIQVHAHLNLRCTCDQGFNLSFNQDAMKKQTKLELQALIKGAKPPLAARPPLSRFAPNSEWSVRPTSKTNGLSLMSMAFVLTEIFDDTCF